MKVLVTVVSVYLVVYGEISVVIEVEEQQIHCIYENKVIISNLGVMSNYLQNN